jgi:hypothetical protein
MKLLSLGLAALPLALAGAAGSMAGNAPSAAKAAHGAIAPQSHVFGAPIVALRRLTEAQYRNAIADIFGPDVTVAGKIEPIVRPVHEMIASGAAEASISPTGLAQFDMIGRNVAAQVFGEKRRGQFVPCAPKDAGQADADCAAAVLTPLGRYLFRRPLTAAEQAFYV